MYFFIIIIKMKSSLAQNQKYRTINELKEDLLKSMRGAQPQKPKVNGNSLNNSALVGKYSNPLKSSSPGISLYYLDKSNIQPTQKKNSTTQQNAKQNYNSNSNKKSIVESEPELDKTTSTIDEIIENVDDGNKALDEFKTKFNETFSTENIDK